MNFCHKNFCEYLLIEVIKLQPLPIKDMVDHSPQVFSVLMGDANGMQDLFHMKLHVCKLRAAK